MYFIQKNKQYIQTMQLASLARVFEKTTKTRSKSQTVAAKKKKAPYDSTPYASHFIPLLDMEMEAEQEQVKERLKWSRQRLERQGLALFELNAQLDGALYGQGVAKLYSYKKLPYHRLTQGDWVLCVRGKESIRGTLLERHSKYLRIVVGEEWMAGKDWTVYQISNTVAFERSKNAVEELITMAQQSDHEISQIIVKSFAKEIIEDGNIQKEPKGGWNDYHTCSSYLVQLVTSQGRQGTLDELCRSRIFPQSPSEWQKIRQDENDWNESQQTAWKNALERRLTLIQGPPGTGKTKTLAKILASLVQLGRTPILASAYTHIATDNILDELERYNIPAIRIGKPANIHRNLWKYSLDSLLERDTRIIEKRENLKKAMERLAQPKRGKAIGLAHRDYSKSLGQLKQTEMIATKEILDKYPIVLSTCVGAGEEILKNISFQVVAIDEATQSHEPGLLIPIIKGCEQLILAGDHYQLPPTILNPEAAESGLSVSLFERLVRSGVEPYLLRTQYRMHPSIAAFPSQYFYHGLLHSAPCTQSISNYFPWPNPQTPIAFIPVLGEEWVTEQGTSYCNPQESQVVIETISQIVENWMTAQNSNHTLQQSFPTIGIITPYAGQMRDIMDRMDRETSTEWLSYVEVKTVDGFQGREKDIIIISTVRSNPSQSLGFLQDWRRLNVAITRSRSGLIVIGNANTLSRNDHWKRWLEWISHHGCIYTR
ncbi:endonuclease [Galdieria sulphuraria]|uniref:Endonuclease n=1 Tax=Galdieria sulphuraria TaxID=130081 RepID=M2XWI7_GALSU|nr:endonuclease [Galdieria sulphuraria]EME27794.1 endonuclease [Galdieria sulphuraria]|eukprot:XP_005704314.1 endonuclease [Galdieria sulphuraria]